MICTVEAHTEPSYALDSARFTAGKKLIGKKPSDEWWRNAIRAGHSILLDSSYRITWEGISWRAQNHLVRHNRNHEKWRVRSNRPDRCGEKDKVTYDVMAILSCQAILHISEQRLCTEAWHETLGAWHAAIDALHVLDPILAESCKPQCIRSGRCCRHDGNRCDIGVCSWNRFDYHGTINTSCGKLFNPKFNGLVSSMRLCPNCGRPIVFQDEQGATI